MTALHNPGRRRHFERQPQPPSLAPLSRHCRVPERLDLAAILFRSECYPQFDASRRVKSRCTKPESEPKILANLRAYPLEFFHESERRAGLWKAIWCSFSAHGGGWIFQDILPSGLSDRAGVRSGATLLAIDGKPVCDRDIPKFHPSSEVNITFQNPGTSPTTFSFDPRSKERRITDPSLGPLFADLTNETSPE